MLFKTSSDEKLIASALDGSQHSWLKLVRRYESLVYGYCLRMTGNRGDAMDLMQEVFLSVYRHLPSYRAEGGFKGWMMRIAVNKSLDHLRRRRRSPLVGDDDGELDGREGPHAFNPQQAWEEAGSNREILRVLAELPPEQRLVVELKFFGHFTFDEISGQTGVPVNTVKSRLYAALQKLKDKLEDQHVL